MDANKLKVLQDLDYQVRKVCGNCYFSRWANKGSNFGTCFKHKYDHLKHSDATRELSINEYGYCSSHMWDTQTEAFTLGAYAQLKEK